jgi:hypothetical protein
MPRMTWGPFTGAQLTTMVVALLACVGFSGGLVAAVAYTNAALYDPATGRRAFFDANRALRVSDAAGPLTVDGLLRVWDGAGPLTVDGAVLATEAAPANYFRKWLFPPPAGCTAILTPPTGKAIVLDTIVVDTTSITDPPGPGRYIGFRAGSSTCSEQLIDLNPTGTGVITVPLRPGITIPAGQSLWWLGANTSSQVLLLGHYVAAAAVPAAAPLTTSSASALSPNR